MSKQSGKRVRLLRRLSMTGVFILVLLSLAFDTGFGTPSAIGVGEFFLLCPLGGVEAMLASKTFLPMAVLSLALVLMLAALFGRAWCAWGCPASGIRSLFGRKLHTGTRYQRAVSDGKKGEPPPALQSEDREAPINCKTRENREKRIRIRERDLNVFGFNRCFPREKSVPKRFYMLFREDKRLLVLVGVLTVSFAVGLPVFCLVCPIGLSFGTVIALWHLFVYKQVTASVLIFPLCLVVELVIYRKWCTNLCPIAALLALFGRLAKGLRPTIDTDTCLLYTGDGDCHACTKSCAEGINLHAASATDDLRDCTRCGECLVACPTKALQMGVKPTPSVLYSSKSMQNDNAKEYSMEK
jgi:ferredoxin-type protein NapH